MMLSEDKGSPGLYTVAFGGYITAFYPTSGMAILGIIIAIFLPKPPKIS